MSKRVEIQVTVVLNIVFTVRLLLLDLRHRDQAERRRAVRQPLRGTSVGQLLARRDWRRRHRAVVLRISHSVIASHARRCASVVIRIRTSYGLVQVAHEGDVRVAVRSDKPEEVDDGRLLDPHDRVLVLDVHPRRTEGESGGADGRTDARRMVDLKLG